MDSTLPKWHLHLCKYYKTPIRVHFSLVVAVPLLLILTGALHGNLFAQTLFIALIFTAYVLDAAIQLMTARKFDIPVMSVLIHPLGASLLPASTAGSSVMVRIRSFGLAPYICLLGLSLTLFETTQIRQILLEGPATITELTALCALFILAGNLFPLCPLPIFHQAESRERLKAILLVNAGLLGLSLFLAQYSISLIFLVLSALCLRRLSELQAIEAAAKLSAGDALIPVDQMLCFSHGTLVSQAIHRASRSEQQFFPITSAGKLLGIVSRKVLLTAHQFQDGEMYLRELAQSDFSSCCLDTPLKQLLLDIFSGSKHYPICVVEEEALIGLILREQLIDFLITRKS